MAYNPTNWEDTLKDGQGNIIQKGTPITAPKLNKIETTLVDHDKKVVEHDKNIASVTAQLADMPTKDYITEKIVEVNTGGTVDISSKASLAYVNEVIGINRYSTVPTFTNGDLTKVEELDGAAVKKRTTIAYNPNGTVNTVTDEVAGKTVISTLNYVNGKFESISKQIIEGGL